MQQPGRVRNLRAGDTNPPEATCEESAGSGCIRKVRVTWSAPDWGGTPSRYRLRFDNLHLPKADRRTGHSGVSTTFEEVWLEFGEIRIEVRAENEGGLGEPSVISFNVTGPFAGDTTWGVVNNASYGSGKLRWSPPTIPTSAPFKSPIIRYHYTWGGGLSYRVLAGSGAGKDANAQYLEQLEEPEQEPVRSQDPLV